MSKLKFKQDATSMPLTEDFWYMIYGGGWCAPEEFLEEEDAIKVRKAIEIIAQYKEQGIDEGFFENT